MSGELQTVADDSVGHVLDGTTDGRLKFLALLLGKVFTSQEAKSIFSSVYDLIRLAIGLLFLSFCLKTLVRHFGVRNYGEFLFSMLKIVGVLISLYFVELISSPYTRPVRAELIAHPVGAGENTFPIAFRNLLGVFLTTALLKGVVGSVFRIFFNPGFLSSKSLDRLGKHDAEIEDINLREKDQLMKEQGIIQPHVGHGGEALSESRAVFLATYTGRSDLRESPKLDVESSSCERMPSNFLVKRSKSS